MVAFETIYSIYIRRSLHIQFIFITRRQASITLFVDARIWTDYTVVADGCSDATAPLCSRTPYTSGGLSSRLRCQLWFI